MLCDTGESWRFYSEAIFFSSAFFLNECFSNPVNCKSKALRGGWYILYTMQIQSNCFHKKVNTGTEGSFTVRSVGSCLRLLVSGEVNRKTVGSKSVIWQYLSSVSIDTVDTEDAHHYSIHSLSHLHPQNLFSLHKIAPPLGIKKKPTTSHLIGYLFNCLMMNLFVQSHGSKSMHLGM